MKTQMSKIYATISVFVIGAIVCIIAITGLIADEKSEQVSDYPATISVLEAESQLLQNQLEGAGEVLEPVSVPSVGNYDYCYWKWYKAPGWNFGGTHEYEIDCYSKPLAEGDNPCSARIEYFEGHGNWLVKLHVYSGCSYSGEWDWLEFVEDYEEEK